MFKKTALLFISVLAVILSPLTILSAYWLKFLRRASLNKRQISGGLLRYIGLLPVIDHYYEPFFNPTTSLRHPLKQKRLLPGINLNIDEQLDLINRFDFAGELEKFPLNKTSELSYYYNNNSFICGDSEYYYSMIRFIKPRKVIEIGSGFSTLMALAAIKANQALNANYSCDLICIEPYEQPWLEKTAATIIRKKVEDVPIALFKELGQNDILFIDSSHIVKPQGDVLHEYLDILPQLNVGTYIHIHDIFTPADYPEEWIVGQQKLWNEQYILEAFLSCNNQFKIVGALNFLKNNYPYIMNKFPILLAQQSYSEPGSFWIMKSA